MRRPTRPHPMTLLIITCDLLGERDAAAAEGVVQANADVYGWEGPLMVCQYCEDPSPTAICDPCRADLGIPAKITA